MPNELAKECFECPEGSYCVGDHITPKNCPQGFYCPNRTGYDWQGCPPGTFSNQVGLANSSSMIKLVKTRGLASALGSI